MKLSIVLAALLATGVANAGVLDEQIGHYRALVSADATVMDFCVQARLVKEIALQTNDMAKFKTFSVVVEVTCRGFLSEYSLSEVKKSGQHSVAGIIENAK